MSEFTTHQKIKSCTFTLEILQKIEKYLLEDVPNLIKVDKNEIKKKYNISIGDSYGKEVFNSITEYKFNILENSINEVQINLSYFNNNFIKIDIDLNNNNLYSNNTIRISCNIDNAKDMTLSIKNNLNRIFETEKNVNWIFHNNYINFTLLILISSVLFFIFNKIFLLNHKKDFTIIFIFSWCCTYIINLSLIYIIKKIYPFYAFDTKKHRKFIKNREWFFKGLLGFIIFTVFFGSIFLFFRKQILGI